MNQDEFVAAIKLTVHDSAIAATKKRLLSPPGRSPHPKNVQLSAWFKSLSEADQMRVEEVIHQAVHDSVFGFLCVLDEVVAIESEPNKGSLELWFKKEGHSELVNDHRRNDLHDIYQALVQGEVFGK
jgi:hypothetical protein